MRSRGDLKKVLVIFGTRPEAIKLSPVILELKKKPDIQTRVCVTAQHREMLDQVLGLFSIVPDFDLNLMQPDQSLADITATVVDKSDKLLKRERPDVVLIQGDTTSAMAAALAAFYNKIAVGHVEAGLRSNNLYSPYPEEMNRKVTTMLSRYHFAPTERAKHALINEGIPESRIYVTGNTVIDSLLMISKKPAPDIVKRILNTAGINGNRNDKKMVLLTAHRRENFGERLESICNGIKLLIKRNPDICILYPVHMNPSVRTTVFRILKDVKRVILIDPVEYDVLVHLMKASYIVLTDSGGIQEEAPSLGKPVLVMRTETERPEGIEAGTAELVGPFEDKIVEKAEKLLKYEHEYHKMAKIINPYGDGKAAERIVEALLS